MLLIILIVTLLLLFSYVKLIKPLNYWKEKGVPYMKPWPVFGNMASIALRTKAFAYHLQDAYNQFPNQRYFGFYQFSLPTLMIRDPELVKQICIKDFDAFMDHQELLPKSTDTFWNKNLFSMTGKDWHDMRSVLSPAFTSSKMKTMFCLMAECAQEFVAHFQKQSESGTVTLEMKDTFLRCTNDIIASTAFGIKCDSLQNRDNEFFRLGRDAFDFNGLKSLKFFGQAISPTLMKLLKVSFFDEYTRKFFLGIIKDTIRYREKTGTIRPDMIHLLREAQKGRLQDEHDVADGGRFPVTKESAADENKSQVKAIITEEDIAAQAMLFFFGGFDTVSILLCHMAYELAINPAIQNKLFEEVHTTSQKCNDHLTYDALINMKYLDMVVSETLRMWTAGVVTNRKIVKPFTIQPKLPGEKPLHLEPGVVCWIPVYAIQRDPKYFPNPNKFDPERFNDENKNKFPTVAYLPFGTGPRSCLASRFAILEAKTIMFYLLAQYEIVPVEKTQIPFVLSKKNINIINDEGYWLGLKPRK